MAFIHVDSDEGGKTEMESKVVMVLDILDHSVHSRETEKPIRPAVLVLEGYCPISVASS